MTPCVTFSFGMGRRHTSVQKFLVPSSCAGAAGEASAQQLLPASADKGWEHAAERHREVALR